MADRLTDVVIAALLACCVMEAGYIAWLVVTS